MTETKTLEDLIALFSKVPGLGPRSARRAVLALLKKKELLLKPLLKALSDVAETIIVCENCGNLDTVSPCAICVNPKRDPATVCVVADLSDLWAIERTGIYKGQYLVLGGLLSAFEGITPDDLFLAPLRKKNIEGKLSEVIFALPSTLEGQTTQHYIMQVLETERARVENKESPEMVETSGQKTKISALARGLPAGAELDYLDDTTLESAFQSRIELR